MLKRFLCVVAVLAAAAWLAACSHTMMAPCGHGPGTGRCAQCPKAADCQCMKEGKCLCKNAQCPNCPKGAECACKDGKCAKCGAACRCAEGKCAGCGANCPGAAGSPCANCPRAAGAADAKELQHGPCGPPEGAKSLNPPSGVTVK